MEDGALGDTLGDEARGMVVVDFDGHPQKFDQMEILSQFVAKEVNVLKVDVPRVGGKGWKRTNSEIETQDTDLGNSWCEEVSTGAKYVLEETWVKANDPHHVRASVLRVHCSVSAFVNLCRFLRTRMRQGCESLADCPPLRNRQRALRGRQRLSCCACAEQGDFDTELVSQDGALGFLETRLPDQDPPLPFEFQQAKKGAAWPVDRRAGCVQAAFRHHDTQHDS